MTDPVTPQRPYLLRAMHEWMTDNGQTPHIVVDAGFDGVDVPQQHVQDGKIILNISYAATNNLEIGNDEVRLEARFGGSPHQVSVPVRAVLGIYARESGRGMIFSEEEFAAAAEEAQVREEKDSTEPRKPHLKIIK